MVTIGQLRIDWIGRVEVLVYDQNRFIRSRIRKIFKEVKNPYRRMRVTAVVGHRYAARTYSQHAPAGIYKKEKKNLISLIDQLDKKAKTSILSDNEINMKHYLKERLVTLLREEEIKWYERVKVQNLLQGDDNTRFFHLIASNKRRKQHIFILEQEDGIIVGDNELKRYITRYYKNLYGQPMESDIHLDESRIDDIPQMTNTENEILISPFTMDEIKEAVF
jgi:hypothetical protein